ncbi:MAG TPA: hypothetical protein VIV58_11940 [Kofleriaceae bacterium]
MMRFASYALAASLMFSACVSDDDIDPATSSQSQDLSSEIRPKHVHGAKGEAAKAARTSSISYHGGPVMTGTVNIHYIWYGNWSGNTATTILTDLANGIGGSTYEQINATYYNGSGTHVSGNIAYAGSTNDNYSHGTSLSDAQIEQVVAATNPTDTNAIYMVLTSSDVTASSGFCTQYCGWHTNATINGRDIKYSFVGNPDRCPSACEAQTTGPNGNAGADGMASIIAHETEEAISDPDLNAWYDRQGAENADKCAWTFGNESTASNGAKYNLTFGNRNWLIQRNWNASTQGCQRVLASTN